MKCDPNIVVLAGPNGAGKTTAAPALLRGVLRVDEYVNPDVIAQGLSGYSPDAVALEAARIMLERMRQLAAARRSFAFETTLASRSDAPWLRQLIAAGYRVHLVFLWLPSADMAVQRVAERVRLGGHAIPPDTIGRRYGAGLRNLFELYRSLAATWTVYDSSVAGLPATIATGGAGVRSRVVMPTLWRRIRKQGRP